MGCRHPGPGSSGGSMRGAGAAPARHSQFQPDTAGSRWFQPIPARPSQIQPVPARYRQFQPDPTTHHRARLSPTLTVGVTLGKIFKKWQNHQMTERSGEKMEETTLGTLRWEKKELKKIFHVLEQRSPCSPWRDHGEGGVSQQLWKHPHRGREKV